MNLFFSYKSRLAIYIILLVAFLALTLGYSYRLSTNTLLQAANESLVRISQLLESRLISGRDEMQRYAEVVKDNVRFKEYMYIVVKVGSETQPLELLYQNQFAWLPVDHYLLVDHTGKKLIGNLPDTIAGSIATDQKILQGGSTYLINMNVAQLVVSAPVEYRGHRLGTIIMVRNYDIARLNTLKILSNAELILEYNGIIQACTIGDHAQMPLQAENERIVIDDEIYHIRPVTLQSYRDSGLRLWIGISETHLTQTLDQYGFIIFIMVVVLAMLIFSIGLLMMRDFNRPLDKLLSTTSAITRGELPMIKRGKARNEIERLANNFADMVQSLRDKEEMIADAQEELERLAVTDSLTALFNRRYLMSMFPKFQADARRNGKFMTAVLFDIDHFKRINDQCGHPAGDHCLVQLATTIRNNTRANDYVFRMGGEEFMVLGMHSAEEGSLTMADKLRAAVEYNKVLYDSLVIPMTISCGVASIPPAESDRVNLSSLINCIDGALYQAKQSGRNRIVKAPLRECLQRDEKTRLSESGKDIG